MCLFGNGSQVFFALPTIITDGLFWPEKYLLWWMQVWLLCYVCGRKFD